MGQWRGENTRPEQKVILVVYFFVSGVCSGQVILATVLQ